MSAIKLKRVYEEPAKQDGARVLVDRIWPRGVSKKNAAVDLWLKEIAPSDTLRKWYGHDPGRWQEFRRRYRDELTGAGDALERIIDICRQGTVSLIFAARDEDRSNAAVLKEFLEDRLASSKEKT